MVSSYNFNIWPICAPWWADKIIKRVSNINGQFAYAYVSEDGRRYQYILLYPDYHEYAGKEFNSKFVCGGDIQTYEVMSERPKYNEVEVGEDVLVHFEGDHSDVWTKFKLEYVKGDVVVLYDYRVNSVGSYCFSRLSFKKYVKSSMEEAIEKIASLIGRGTFSEDAASIYDAIKSNEIRIFEDQ